jgi:pseudaminic acid synthase
MTIKINNRLIGEAYPVYIVAELSANHLQDYHIAVETLKSIKESGADAVKLQTYTPDTITIDCNNEYFQLKQGTIWDGMTLYELYKNAYTPWEWQPALKKYADEIGITLFSSPFDRTAVDFLEKMNVPAYKIASFELTDIPLIEYVSSKGRPVFISTGIATLPELEEALNACKRMGNNQVILLKCTSEYPAAFEEMNLNTIPDMINRFGLVCGISDHSHGSVVPVASVALGAKVVEKHFILDRSMGGPDAAFSMEPLEFAQMVQMIRDTEKALGNVDYDLSDKATKNRVFCRSLFAVQNINKGEAITEKNVRSIRPGYGLPPVELKNILGLKASEYIKRGDPISYNILEKGK